MKRFMILLMITTLLAAAALPAAASGGSALTDRETDTGTAAAPTTFADAAALFQYWEAFGYPDYVSGVWTATGGTAQLVIGITEQGGEAARRELLALIENDASVSFVTQKYSYNYLRGVQEDITAYLMGRDLGSWGIGVFVMQGRVELFLEHGTDHEATALVVRELLGQYGDALAIVTENGPITAYTLEIDPGVVTDAAVHPGKQLLTWLPFALILLLLASASVLIVRRRAVLQTAGGATVEVSATLSRADVERRVRDDAPAPSAALDARVLSHIQKT